MPETLISAGDIPTCKKNKDPCSCGAYVLVRSEKSLDLILWNTPVENYLTKQNTHF